MITSEEKEKEPGGTTVQGLRGGRGPSCSIERWATKTKDEEEMPVKRAIGFWDVGRIVKTAPVKMKTNYALDK